MWLSFLLQSSPQDDDADVTCTYTWPTLAHHIIITNSRIQDEPRLPTTVSGGHVDDGRAGQGVIPDGPRPDLEPDAFDDRAYAHADPNATAQPE